MQFFNKLSLREKSIIIGGAVFLVMFLLYFLVISGLIERSATLKKKVDDEREKQQLISLYVEEYESLVQERDLLRKKIKERDVNFSLAREVSEIQNQLGFPSRRIDPERPRTKFEKYTQVGTRISYTGKALNEIVNFLYEVEKPERGIIVENFRLEPLAKDRGRFNFNIKLYSVSLIEK